MVIHVALLTADQVHPAAAVTATVPEPPPTMNDREVGEIETGHPGGGGG
jgi:hypothetical protein